MSSSCRNEQWEQLIFPYRGKRMWNPCFFCCCRILPTRRSVSNNNILFVLCVVKRQTTVCSVNIRQISRRRRILLTSLLFRPQLRSGGVIGAPWVREIVGEERWSLLLFVNKPRERLGSHSKLHCAIFKNEELYKTRVKRQFVIRITVSSVRNFVI